MGLKIHFDSTTADCYLWISVGTKGGGGDENDKVSLQRCWCGYVNLCHLLLGSQFWDYIFIFRMYVHVSINDNSRGQMHHLYFISDGCKLASCKMAVFFKVCMIFIDNTMTSWFPVASVFFPIKLETVALKMTSLPSILCVSSSSCILGTRGKKQALRHSSEKRWREGEEESMLLTSLKLDCGMAEEQLLVDCFPGSTKEKMAVPTCWGKKVEPTIPVCFDEVSLDRELFSQILSKQYESIGTELNSLETCSWCWTAGTEGMEDYWVTEEHRAYYLVLTCLD